MNTFKTSKSFFILFSILFIQIIGCSNMALKEHCERINWFEYSQNIAFKGKYLEEDGLVKECSGVDRTNATQMDLGFKLGRDKMCSYDEITNRGQTGQTVFFKFCDGLDLQVMKKKYQDGLAIFCTQDQGYKYGKSGEIYLNVCNSNQEVQFLPAYYRGRKEYLNIYLNDLSSLEKKLTLSIDKHVERENSTSRAYAAIPNLLDCKNLNVYNEATKKNEIKSVCHEPDHISNQRNSLFISLKSLKTLITRDQNQLDDTRKKMQWVQQEIAKAP